MDRTDDHLSTTQRRVFDELVRDGEAVHPGVLGVRLGLHVSTIRHHLETLEAAGLVERMPARDDSPGRPRMLYRVARVPRDVPACQGYRFVAECLARWVEQAVADAREVAADVGDAWGRHLANAPPFTRTPVREAVERALDVLAGLGYGPSGVSVDGLEVELGRCPFGGLTRVHPDIGCGLHLGIVRGALSSLGADAEIAEFRPSPADVTVPCRVRLARTGTGAKASAEMAR